MHFDLVIVGGGLVGASLAAALKHARETCSAFDSRYALAQKPLKVALVDAKLPSANDPRLFALNYYSCQFLDQLGVWPKIESLSSPIHEVHVSVKKRFGSLKLKGQDQNLPALGSVIPAYHIESALNEVLIDSNVILFRPFTLSNITQINDLAMLTIESSEESINLTADIVVGADGTASTVRKLLNIPAETIEYNEMAIVTKTTLKRHHGQIAYERFLEEGAIAMLPLLENQCATIWSTNTAHAKELLSLTNEAFLSELQTHFGYRLGKLLSVGQRFSYPLRMVKAKKALSGNIYLLGNAAHTLHPIAAQGFNLSLYEVACLTEILSTADSLTKSHLAEFDKRIKKRKDISIEVSHRLSSLFSTSQTSLFKWLMPMGMACFGSMLPLKKQLTGIMLGNKDPLPRLMIGTDMI